MIAFTGLALAASAAAGALHFTEIAAQAGIRVTFGYETRIPTSAQMTAGGVAAGDLDGDGLTDLFVVAGATGPAQLLRNRGDGTFEDIATQAGVAFVDSLAIAPLAFDADGDGRLDLFLGSIRGGPVRLLHNVGGRFEDVTAASGITATGDTFSATAADYDGDGLLDLFLAHWGAPAGECHLWRNLGGMRFACADDASGLSDLVRGPTDYTFTGNFADLDQDGLLDLLVTSDFGTSRVYVQGPSGHFRDVTGPEINDENGMGSALGDIDGDGRIDWFVSSVWDPDGFAEGTWGVTGNRLYRNRGGGRFDDRTDLAGVRHGYWGWGASLQDLDNDGVLDLVHVNGFPRSAPEFHFDPTCLFRGNGDGTLSECAFASGLVDTAQGRGIVVFDADGDGDLDLFLANNGQAAELWRNDGDRTAGWLEVECRGRAPNPQGIGALVSVTANGVTQTREIRAGTNFLSQDPALAHFGLGSAHQVTALRVAWPDGSVSQLSDVAADRRLVVAPPAPSPPGQVLAGRPNPFSASVRFPVPTPGGGGGTARVLDVNGRALRRLPLAPGQRSVVWDGRDDEGRDVPAGLYWLSMPNGSRARVARVP